MVRMSHAHKLGLAAVLAATELPTALDAVVGPTALAVEDVYKRQRQSWTSCHLIELSFLLYLPCCLM